MKNAANMLLNVKKHRQKNRVRAYILGFVGAGAMLFSALHAGAQTASELARLFNGSEVMSSHFVGFKLYDPRAKEVLYEQDADKYFTPASNTKLYTVYAALTLLGDSIPALRYVERGDSLVFWGTGDPTLLNPAFGESDVLDFLRSSGKQLYYATGNYTGNPFGRGWEWNDYAYYYQPEIHAMPIYGNVVNFKAASNRGIQATPSYFAPYLQLDYTMRAPRFTIQRDHHDNTFRYNGQTVPATLNRWAPFKTSDRLLAALLSDTLRRQVQLTRMAVPDDARFVYSHPLDTVLRAMMLPSDNHIAEQLLLVCAAMHLGAELNADSIRRYIVDEYLDDLPQRPEWHDGSGLSRYNLSSPASMVRLLEKLQEVVPDEERLLALFPAGGVSGTLERVYPTRNGRPFVWAKTGTLSNNHNQSGYLITKSGRKLIYSFMNNNYVRPVAEIRQEMARIITAIHDNY